MRSLTRLKAVRSAAKSNPVIQVQFEESIQAVTELIKSRFAMVTWQGQKIKVNEAASIEEIEEVSNLLKIVDNTIEPDQIQNLKDLTKYPALEKFLEQHGRCRYYSFQVNLSNV